MKPNVFKPKEPPLIREEAIEIDPESGCEFLVTRHKRGVLKQEVRTARSALAVKAIFEKLAAEPPRRWLENYCDRFRDELTQKGLPHDRPLYWVLSDKGEWEPEKADDSRRGNPGVKAQHWMSRLEEQTEPLSLERHIALALRALSRVLQDPRIDDELLSRMCDAMCAFAYLRVSRFNAAASEGMKARKSRQLGPQARSRKANEQRKTALEHAEKLWSERPALRGDASNTAQHIVNGVNEVLRSQGLLSSTDVGLKAKTLADYIRDGLSGKIL